LTLLAVSGGSGRQTLVEQLIRDSFDPVTDSIEVADLYGEALPLYDLVDCFRGFAGIEKWALSLYRVGFCDLRYLLFTVRRNGVARCPAMPSLGRGSYSGSWQGRLARYRTWLDALAELRETAPQRKFPVECLEAVSIGGL